MKLLYKKKCLVIHTQNRRVLIDFGALIEYPFSYISFTTSHFVELFVIKLNDTVQRKKNKEKSVKPNLPVSYYSGMKFKT